jgi:hypothetical protein
VSHFQSAIRQRLAPQQQEPDGDEAVPSPSEADHSAQPNDTIGPPVPAEGQVCKKVPFFLVINWLCMPSGTFLYFHTCDLPDLGGSW